MADGKIIFEVRADDSKVEEDLEKAEKKVKKSGDEITETAKKSGKKTEKASKETGEEIKETTKKTGKDVEKTSKETGEKVKKHGHKVGEKLKSVAKGAAKGIGAAFATIGTGAIAMGTAAIMSADSMDKAMNQYIASTGKGKDETERYQKVLENIYTNNYGESFEDIADKMGLVSQQLGDMSDEELQKIVESGYLLQDTFDIDFSESLRGVNAMIKQFGVDGETAYNLIAQGAQNGLNQNGDLADQIAEYSVYFADMGFTAEEMFNIMSNGAKDGTFQIDYLNDAIKEFGIRTKDGSDGTKEAFKALGLNADSLTKKFANGGQEARQAFDEVVTALSGVKDSVKQNELGVALFGTKWEDLGMDAVLSMRDVQGEISATNDALGEMGEVKYNSLSEMLTQMKRIIDVVLMRLGEEFIPVIQQLADDVFPYLLDAIQPLLDVFEVLLNDLILPLIDTFKESLAPFSEELSELWEQFAGIIEDLIPVILDLVDALLPPMMEIITTILPVLMDLIDELLPPLMELFESLLVPLLDVIMALLDPILQLIEALLPPLVSLINSLIPCINSLVPIIKWLADIIGDTLSGAINLVMPLIDDLINAFNGLLDFITGVFTGDWQKAWNGIVNMFRGIFNLIPGIAESVINGAINIINGIIKGINSVTGVVGIPSIPTIPKVNLPRFHVGGIVDFDSPEGLALLQSGEMVLTQQQQATLFAMANGDIPHPTNSPINDVGGMLMDGLTGLATVFSDTEETPPINLTVKMEVDGKEFYERTYRDFKEVDRRNGGNFK